MNPDAILALIQADQALAERIERLEAAVFPQHPDGPRHRELPAKKSPSAPWFLGAYLVAWVFIITVVALAATR